MNKRLSLTAVVAGMIVVMGASAAQAEPADPWVGLSASDQTWALGVRGLDRLDHRVGLDGVDRPASVTAEEGSSFASAHMGLSLQAWQEYRAGERASVTDTGAQGAASGHLGLSPRAWQEHRAGERAS